MRILIDNGVYDLLNLGDIAMLQMAITRLFDSWPEATIEVITNTPDLLNKYCPKASPLSNQAWLNNNYFSKYNFHCLPHGINKTLKKLEDTIWLSYPSFSQSLISLRYKLKGRESSYKEIDTFFQALRKAELVVASGGGYINDLFPDHANGVLNLLAAAKRLGKSTAMFGQGLGPIDSPGLMAKARFVFPKIDHICLREKITGPGLLKSFGFPERRVFVTGDDAIEAAYNNHQENGQGIGINIRKTSYSEVDEEFCRIFRETLLEASGRYKTQLIPIPISRYAQESDARALRELFAGSLADPDGGECLDLPEKIIEQVGRCRVVVTCSYHAAVFALAQGVPAIGIANSRYYQEKFQGLADMFEAGCSVVYPDELPFKANLLEKIDFAWNSSGQLKAALLGTANKLVLTGKEAYRKVLEECRIG
jgi:colanic acid/amylovoran biosynthesis protein